MITSLSKIEVIGNLAKDPDMKYLPSGAAVTTVSVPVNKRRKDKSTGEQIEKTTWFQVKIYGRQAEFVNQYLKKGCAVRVEGELEVDETGGPRIWKDKDGNPRTGFTILVNDFEGNVTALTYPDKNAPEL